MVVKDCDIPRGLVGHVDFVSLIAESDQRPAHGDDVVVRVRAEDHDTLREYVLDTGRVGNLPGPEPRPARLPARPTSDRFLDALENADVDLIRPAPVCYELLQPVLVVVLVGQLQDGFLQRLGKPEHGSFGSGLIPVMPEIFDRAEQPWRLEASEFGGRRGIEHEPRVRVVLKVRGRNVRVDLALDGSTHNGRLVLAEGQQDDAVGAHDCADTHGDRGSRDIPLTEKVAGRVHARDLVERDEPRAALQTRARFVESDVTCSTDAQNLEVDPACGLDLLLIGAAVRTHALPVDRAIGNVHLLARDVHVVEQVFIHETHITLEVVRSHGVILVQIERDHIGEAQPFLTVEPDQLVIHGLGRRAGCQAENDLPARSGTLANQCCDFQGHGPAGIDTR